MHCESEKWGKMVKSEFGIDGTDSEGEGTKKRRCLLKIVLGSKNSDINS
jgi:hypothetical protein